MTQDPRHETPAATAAGELTRGHDYTERLARLEQARWKQVLDVQRPYRWNLRRLDLGRVLEIGCGIGRNLEALPGAVGVDHNSASIAVARSRGFEAYDEVGWAAVESGFVGGFDTLLMAHLLEHVESHVADDIVASYLPYLRGPGIGARPVRVVVICPQEKGYPTDPTHVRFVDDRDIAAHLGRHGFAVERSYSFPFPRPVGRVFTYNEFVVVGVRVSVAA